MQGSVSALSQTCAGEASDKAAVLSRLHVAVGDPTQNKRSFPGNLLEFPRADLAAFERGTRKAEVHFCVLSKYLRRWGNSGAPATHLQRGVGQVRMLQHEKHSLARWRRSCTV